MTADTQTRAKRQAEYAKRTGYAAQAKYTKENAVRVLLVLNKNTESDLIHQLQSVDNKSGYIKNLIKQDIEKK
ncbi:MAG: hypothetical protein FWB87_13775 [Defluviitaleaceae bacterium]|nr:hypothetical protein [Defluviitaleaceae bacterium]